MEQALYRKKSPGALHSNTLELLRTRPRTLTLEQIARDTGIELGWLSKFGSNKIGDPSVNRVEALRNYLLSKFA
jgi:hypothetical protein